MAVGVFRPRPPLFLMALTPMLTSGIEGADSRNAKDKS
jgi:hypothetical protein